jgi:large conductance mechanosensitive channel
MRQTQQMLEQGGGLVRRPPGIVQEFRDFIARGNVVDLAVAVIIGAAFTGIVNSLVKDIISPIIGLLLGGINFSALYLNLSGQTFESYAAAQEAGAAVLGYGTFLDAVLTFLITALAVFLLVKAVNRFYRKAEAEPPPPAPPTKEEELLTEIRDLLAQSARRA